MQIPLDVRDLQGKRLPIARNCHAVLVAYSRVYVGAHYPLDVVAGAVVGIVTGWLVWQGHEALARRRRPIN